MPTKSRNVFTCSFGLCATKARGSKDKLPIMLSSSVWGSLALSPSSEMITTFVVIPVPSSLRSMVRRTSQGHGSHSVPPLSRTITSASNCPSRSGSGGNSRLPPRAMQMPSRKDDLPLPFNPPTIVKPSLFTFTSASEHPLMFSTLTLSICILPVGPIIPIAFQKSCISRSSSSSALNPSINSSSSACVQLPPFHFARIISSIAAFPYFSTAHNRYSSCLSSVLLHTAHSA